MFSKPRSRLDIDLVMMYRTVKDTVYVYIHVPSFGSCHDVYVDCTIVAQLQPVTIM